MLCRHRETHDEGDRSHYCCSDAQRGGVSTGDHGAHHRNCPGRLARARRAQSREVERIFDFYIAADAILREEERRWYGFEIAEVIEHGESLLRSCPTRRH